MKLCNAAGTASVDLFFRSLQLKFPADRAAGGLVGGYVDPRGVLPEDELATLLHECEHVTALQHPIGPLMRALALRAHNLRNDFAVKANTWRRTREDGSKVVLACGLAKEFVHLVQNTADLFLPLFEGMALLAEFEERGYASTPVSATWRLPVHLQLAYLDVANPGALRAQAGSPTQWGKVIAEMAAYVWRQVEHARELKRAALGDAIFWHIAEAAPAPYFYGYLYLHRLFQAWRDQGVVQNLTDFVGLARHLCYQVFPMSLLPFYSLSASPGEAASVDLPRIFFSLLNGALDLPRNDIENLRSDQHGVLIFSSDFSGLCRHPASGVGGGKREAEVFALILLSVFDTTDIDVAAVRSTFDAFYSLDEATRLAPAKQCDVLALGLDEPRRRLVLLDLSNAEVTREGTDFAVAMRRGTLLPFELGEHGLTDLKSVLGSEWAAFPRVDSEAKPLEFTLASGVFRTRLTTFWWFWPNGIDDSFSESELRPLRYFVHGDKLFVDPDDALARRLVLNRALAAQIERHLTKTLDPDAKEAREVLSWVRDLGDDFDRIYAEMATADLDVNSPGDRREACLQAYEAALFPSLDSDRLDFVRVRRLAAVSERLDAGAVRSLRRWLRRGLVLHEDGARLGDEERLDEVELTVRAIRNVSLEVLGLPLVELDVRARCIRLDLAPRA